jgi:hypothetical protein
MELGRALHTAVRRQQDAAATVRAAELEAAAAVDRYRRLRRAPTAATAQARSSRWRRLVLTAGGVGLLVAAMCLGLIVVAYRVPGPLLIVPVAAALYVVATVAAGTERPGARAVRRPAAEAVRHPATEDLVDAVLEVREAVMAVRRAREQARVAAEHSAALARVISSRLLPREAGSPSGRSPGRGPRPQTQGGGDRSTARRRVGERREPLRQ